MDNQEKINWIKLARAKNVGSSTFFDLLNHFGNINDALLNAAEYSKRKIQIPSQEEAEKELENVRKFGAKIICFYEKEYPKLLKQVASPPPVLTAKGDVSLLNKDTIAIVGPRNPSLNGIKFAEKIAKDLGDNDLVTVSGLARGIDTAAHRSSLQTGTIAVVGSGINHIYPRENAKLYHQIFESGLVITEFPFGTAPKSENFPRRNRIISGLSLGTVVVEATLRSGTLITARFAIEQNREVFAVPGSPFDPRCQGTNQLIKQGAKLTENIDDILEDINPLRNFKEDIKIANPEKEKIVEKQEDIKIDDIQKLILTKISYTPINSDDIISELQIPAKLANVAFTELEMLDKIENKNGKICLK